MTATAAAPNHPLAPRMAAIAFLAQNGGVGFMFGSIGLLLAPIEAKLGVLRDTSSLAVPLVMLGMALMAPVVGALAGKISIRLLMLLGAAMSAAGYALLATVSSVAAYLLAYGLLIGPGLCLLATVTPATLVTRWFDAGRGRALGIVHMPLAVALVPILVAVVLRSYGLSATYLVMAAGSALLILPLLFVVDFPPTVREAGAAADAAPPPVDNGLSVGEILRRPDFWALALSAAAIASGGTMLVTHLAPMAEGWGVPTTQAAGLLAIMALSGIAGSLIFGWLADRLGGGWALAINCLDQVALWGILLLGPPFPVLAVVVGLIGVHGAAISATFGMALSEKLGAASFGRAFGLSNLINLPFLVASVPIGAWFVVNTGSYAGAIVFQIAFFVIGAVFALTARRSRKAGVLAQANAG
jgi:predicted MFS family arabinose efflux permease